MRRRILASVAVALLALVACSSGYAANRAASPFGVMAGVVTDPRGTPQMGAAVALLALDGRTLRQVYTDDRGGFLLERLVPGIYSLRVTLSNYLPVLKENILIQPGVHSFLSVNLVSLFNTMDILRGRRPVTESDDDWTWVLRTSAANRPLLRYLPGTVGKPQAQAGGTVPGALPTVLQFSGGAGRSSSAGSEADFNTSFALANQIFDNTSLLLSGNVGYERSTPATAFRGVLRREMANGSAPEVSVTLRQIFLPGAFWDRGPGHDDTMQNITVSASNRFQLADTVRLEYGFLWDSISFLRRLNSFSPYGRIIYEPGPNSALQLSYTEGAPRLHMPGGEPLRQVASDLAVFPRLSMRANMPAVQRGRHVELAYLRKLGPSTTAHVGVYHDELDNLALSSVIEGEPPSADFFPDVFTQNYSYNSGNFSTGGLRVAVQQKLSERLQTTFAYGYAGVLTPERNVLFSNSPEELRSVLHMQRRHALAAKLAADIPVTRTRVFATYKWVLATTVSTGDIYDDSIAQAEPNLNIVIRQPLPSFIVLPGRVEALADFRNLLAQGYVPIITADGQRLLLVQSSRSFRGGFSFHF